MTNRLNTAAPVKNLDDMMHVGLADYCKDMVSEGKDKTDIIKWVADRFDHKGRLNLRKAYSGLRAVRDDGEQPWMLEENQLYTFNKSRIGEFKTLTEATLAIHAEDPTDTAGQYLLNFLGAAEQADGYVIWRMCRSESSEDMILLYGALLQGDIDDGTNRTTALPMPCYLDVFKILLKYEVLSYFGQRVDQE